MRRDEIHDGGLVGGVHPRGREPRITHPVHDGPGPGLVVVGQHEVLHERAARRDRRHRTTDATEAPTTRIRMIPDSIREKPL